MTRPLAQRLFRVDPRLVHATMMNVWVPTTGARVMVIGDAELAADPKRKAILEMSAMGVVDVVFTSEQGLGAALGRIDSSVPSIVMFSTLEGAERALAAGLPIERLNIGHVPEGPSRAEIHPAVHLGPKDFEVIDRLQDRGVEVFLQPLPQDKVTVIPRRRKKSATKGPDQEHAEVSAQLRVVNQRGLHLRAAHVLAHLAGKLTCHVTVGPKSSGVNAKSLLGLTTLGASCGTMLDVHVAGPGAREGMEQIRQLFEGGFDEGADWVESGEEHR